MLGFVPCLEIEMRVKRCEGFWIEKGFFKYRRGFSIYVDRYWALILGFEMSPTIEMFFSFWSNTGGLFEKKKTVLQS